MVMAYGDHSGILICYLYLYMIVTRRMFLGINQKGGVKYFSDLKLIIQFDTYFNDNRLILFYQIKVKLLQ